jgi:hypothetical protein
LRCAFRGGVPVAFFQEACLQPLPQDAAVQRGVGRQPVVADPVEARLDVPLQDPGSCPRVLQRRPAVLQCVGAAALTAEAVGVAVRPALGDGAQAEQVERLHGPVGQRRDAQGAPLAVALGDVHAPWGLRPIAARGERVQSGGLRLRGVPEDAVRARGRGTLVGEDSQDGQGAAGERVGEQVDQGFDFAPPARPKCLHDTHPEPTGRPPDLLPVDGMPVGRPAGSGTRRC